MTLRIEQQSGFVKLLLTSSREQVLAILKHINKPQVLVICEIILNVLANNIKLSSYYKYTLSRKRVFYKGLGDRRVNYMKKLSLIQKNPLNIFILLKAVKNVLLEYLNGL